MSAPERKPLWIRVKRVEDLCRLAATMITMGQPTYLVRIKSSDSPIVGLLAVYRDYYKFYGVPVFYYAPCEGSCAERKYVSFKVDESGERVEFVDRAVPGSVMIPIIELDSLPELLTEKAGD